MSAVLTRRLTLFERVAGSGTTQNGRGHDPRIRKYMRSRLRLRRVASARSVGKVRNVATHAYRQEEIYILRAFCIILGVVLELCN
jgi:hypothetical protein